MARAELGLETQRNLISPIREEVPSGDPTTRMAAGVKTKTPAWMGGFSYLHDMLLETAKKEKVLDNGEYQYGGCSSTTHTAGN